MGKIVFAAATSHAPHITGFPDRAAAAQRDRFYGAMAEIGVRLRAARPDLLVIVASDHLNHLSTQCMPAFCIGTAASHAGPVEKWIRIDPFNIAGNEAFADRLLRGTFARGFDPAFSQRIALEHGIAVPLSMVVPGFDIPLLPILQNCMVPPMPGMRRCFEFGAAIRAIALESDLRVAVIGTGGLSHSPGAPESGKIDREFDRSFLDMLSSDCPTDILDIANETIDRAGFGTWEIRQWATALGASGGARAQVLAYEPIEAWETGCAAAIFAASEDGALPD